jgi:hypothetical protein
MSEEPEAPTHQQRVADLAVEFSRFMARQEEREIVVWQHVLAEAQVTLAKWAAQPEPEGENEPDDIGY